MLLSLLFIPLIEMKIYAVIPMYGPLKDITLPDQRRNTYILAKIVIECVLIELKRDYHESDYTACRKLIKEYINNVQRLVHIFWKGLQIIVQEYPNEDVKKDILSCYNFSSQYKENDRITKENIFAVHVKLISEENHKYGQIQSFRRIALLLQAIEQCHRLFGDNTDKETLKKLYYGYIFCLYHRFYSIKDQKQFCNKDGILATQKYVYLDLPAVNCYKFLNIKISRMNKNDEVLLDMQHFYMTLFNNYFPKRIEFSRKDAKSTLGLYLSNPLKVTVSDKYLFKWNEFILELDQMLNIILAMISVSKKNNIKYILVFKSHENNSFFGFLNETFLFNHEIENLLYILERFYFAVHKEIYESPYNSLSELIRKTSWL